MAFSDSKPAIPTRFQLSWLLGPLLIVVVAALIAYFLPTVQLSTPVDVVPEQPKIFAPIVNVEQAQVLAQAQCESTFDCSQLDCVEKVLNHIDSSTQTIEAILRTPAPRVIRDHLRSAVRRGVTVNLVLDSKLNPKFFLEGATIRTKSVSKYVATNFMIIDRKVVVYGKDPLVYAAEPDIIKVACTPEEGDPYFALFDRVWSEESSAYTPETNQEEILAEAEIVPEAGGSCNVAACGPDTYTCNGTTKLLNHYFCSDACVYQLLVLQYSTDCGYSNPGFGPDGQPLIVISEAEVDEGQVGNEFLEFLSSESLELTGFVLLKDGEPVLTFPNTFLLDGAARVYTSAGSNASTSVYLNLPSAIWETGTTATLVNPIGNVIATLTVEN